MPGGERMKTRLKLVLGAALVCALSTQARASTLETSGELRVRGWWWDNYVSDGRSDEFWDQRLRLNIDWSVTEQVKVHARADVLEGIWGDNIKKTPVSFDQVNAQVVLPGAPLKLFVGRQDVSWGTGYWVQEDNRDRLAVGLKLEPVAVLVAYDKFTEGHGDGVDRDDADAWAVGVITEAAGFDLGLLVAYLQDRSRTRFPAGDLSYGVGGVFAVGRLGVVDARVEFVYGSGTIDRPGLGVLDARGIGAYASASAPLGPVTLTLEGAYAGGDDPKTSGRNEGFFSADYHGPFWSMIFYNPMEISGYAGDAQSSSPEADFSVRNARAGKLSAVFAPLRRLTVTGAVLYASADQTRAGVDRSMGWEFDVVAECALGERVSLTAGVGYAVLGDYWTSAPIGLDAGGKPENPLCGMLAFTTGF